MNENYVTLGQVCDKGSSNIAQKDLAEREGQYPIYGAAGLIKNVDFAHQKQPYIAVVKDGAGIGRVMKLPAYSSVIGTMQYIFPKENVDIDYLFYALQHMNLGKYFSGSTIPHIYFRDYQKERLKLPVMEVQQRQADTLSRIDALSAYGQRQIALMDEIVKSRFVEMFGDPTLNPYGLEKKRFDTICENLDSRRRPITSSDRVAGIYPYYGASGIVDYVEDYIFDEDILLVSEDGANLLMRSTAIAFSVSGKVWVNNHAHVVRFDNLATQKYIEVYFSLIDISDQITGSAQPKLNQARLNAMEFMYPPIKRQEQFASFVAQVDKSKLAVKQSLEKLETLKKSLMQQYFS